MATFEEQVEGLTGLTINSSGTNPNQSEVTQFLKDGVVEVVNRISQVSPAEIPKFCSTSTTDSGGITVTGKILSVMREHDSSTILRSCTAISPQDRYEAENSDSLKLRSKYNPAYYILDQKIYCVPSPSSGGNSFNVTQIAYDQSLDYTSSSISNFPTEFTYLIPIYAAIKALEAKMAEYTIDEEDPDLVQAISVNIASLKQSYQAAFGLISPPQQEGANNES